jgi:hypothetical protein
MAKVHPLQQGRIKLLDLLSSNSQHLGRKVQKTNLVTLLGQGEGIASRPPARIQDLQTAGE